MRPLPSAVLSAGAVGGSLIAGSRFGLQSPVSAIWYALLRKPPGTPPPPAIGAAWTVLGTLQAYAGYRLMAAPVSARRSVAVASWWVTTLGIVAFPWSFFGRRRLAASTAVALAMVGSTATTAVAASEVDVAAERAAIPLVGWVVFALYLSEELLRRNRRWAR